MNSTTLSQLHGRSQRHRYLGSTAPENSKSRNLSVAAGDVDLDYDLIWTWLWDGRPSKSYPWTLVYNDFLHR